MKGFKGFPGGANMQGLLQQAQKMQKDMARAQEEAESFECDGSAGGGAVKIRVNGKYEVLSVEIKPEAVDPSDVEMLQDAIRIACNDALTKIKDYSQQKLASVTGGLSIPGL
jgi:DNA-binding YbaB/EbfC family protein